MDTAIIALLIFLLTYTGIIFTRLPWINIDRPSAAFFGAMAKLIVIESAEKEGIHIRFMDFLKPGLAVCLVSLLLSYLILCLQYLC